MWCRNCGWRWRRDPCQECEYPGADEKATAEVVRLRAEVDRLVTAGCTPLPGDVAVHAMRAATLECVLREIRRLIGYADYVSRAARTVALEIADAALGETACPHCEGGRILRPCDAPVSCSSCGGTGRTARGEVPR